MARPFRHIGMMAFIAAIIILGFFGPYLLSLLLLVVAGLCWIFPSRREEQENDHSSGASAIGS